MGTQHTSHAVTPSAPAPSLLGAFCRQLSGQLRDMWRDVLGALSSTVQALRETPTREPPSPHPPSSMMSQQQQPCSDELLLEMVSTACMRAEQGRSRRDARSVRGLVDEALTKLQTLSASIEELSRDAAGDRQVPNIKVRDSKILHLCLHSPLPGGQRRSGRRRLQLKQHFAQQLPMRCPRGLASVALTSTLRSTRRRDELQSTSASKCALQHKRSRPPHTLPTPTCWLAPRNLRPSRPKPRAAVSCESWCLPLLCLQMGCTSCRSS